MLKLIAELAVAIATTWADTPPAPASALVVPMLAVDCAMATSCIWVDGDAQYN